MQTDRTLEDGRHDWSVHVLAAFLDLLHALRRGQPGQAEDAAQRLRDLGVEVQLRPEALPDVGGGR